MRQLDTTFEVVERIPSTHAVVILDTAKHGRVVFKGRKDSYPYLTFVAREGMQLRISKLHTFLKQLLNLGAENKSQELEIKVQLALNAKGGDICPKLLTHDKNFEWHVREWVEGTDLEKGDQRPFCKFELISLWQSYAELFECLHQGDDPILYQDSARNNIVQCDGQYCFFDFSEVGYVSAANKPNMCLPVSQIQTKLAAPERCVKAAWRDQRSEYFSFAALFTQLALGNSPWHWRDEAYPEVHSEDRRDFLMAQSTLKARMVELGFVESDINFMTACLEIDIEKRPRSFARPSFDHQP